MSSSRRASTVPQPGNNALVNWAGRNFARFALENDICCVPVDESEEQNYDEVHGIFTHLLGRGAVLPDFSFEDLDEPAVLDCGYGKGQWIDAVLNDNNPDAWCVGIDIYTGQGEDDDDSNGDTEGINVFLKKRWNLNASFRTCRDPDLRPETFDLINSRFLQDGIDGDRWPDYVKELKMLLKPKRWLQMVEAYALFQSDSGQDAPCLQHWWQRYQSTMTVMGKNARIGPTLGALMRNAGFERVHSGVERLVVGEWKPTEREKGREARDTIKKMVRSVTMWPFMRRANPVLTPQQFEMLIQGAERELDRDDLKLYLNVHFAYGRRPAARRR